MAFDISSAKPVNEPSRGPDKFDINSATQISEYGTRNDGTDKGEGFFGLLKMTDGSNRDMTEFAIGVDFGNGETEIPTIASRALGMADAGLSFASGAANTVAGGIAGAVATPFAGAETGANIVNAFTNTIREPATPEGQKTLADAGVAIKSIIDQLNVPLASVGSFIEIMTGQGLDKAVETFSRVKEEGAGIVAGDRVLEETGSPLLATAARITPEAIMEVVGAKGLTGARGLNKGLSVDDVVDPRVAPVVRQGADPVVEAVTGFAKGVKEA